MKGDVVFIPGSLLRSFDLKGYRLWKDHRISYVNGLSNSLSIFVSEKIE
jgi:hypothetical protein